MANPTIQQIKLGNTTYDIKPASAYQDTDTKVKSNNLTSGERPLLLSSATTPTTAAGEVYQNANLKYNAATGVLSAPEITGAYINSHPENGPCLIPFIYNDIAFLEAQGGSVSMYKVASTADMTALTLPNQTVYKPSGYANVFDASPSYMNMSGFTKDDTATSFIIDITLPRVFAYTNVVYIDFGSSGWRAQNIQILVSHTNMTNYVQKASITGLAVSNYKASISHSFTASGATTVTQGFNKIRFVLTKFANASPRIAQIGIINYGSSGTRYTTMSRGIDDQVWRSITPASTKTYSLGSSSNLWNGVYGNTLYAAASIMPTANSAVTMGSSSVLFKDAYSYQAHVNTAVSTQVQVGTGNIIATTTANRSASKYWATDGTIQSVPTVPTALRNPSALTIQFNGVKKVDYTGATTATVNIATLDTVTATVATAASSATAAVKVSTTVSTAGARTATFAFTLPKGADGTSGVVSVSTSGSGQLVSNVTYNSSTKVLTVNKANPQEAYITFGGPNKSGDITPVDMATMENFSANRLALGKAAGVTIEYSNDGGTTYTDYGASDAQKIAFISSNSATFALGKRTTSNTGIDADRLRITLNATNMGLYTKAQKLYINYNSNGLASTICLIETSNKGSETTWTKFGEFNVSGWSGWNSIPLGFAFGGSAGQTTNKANIRLTFIGTHATTGNYTKAVGSVLNLTLAGSTYWATPSNLARIGHTYIWDTSKNTIFNEGGVSIGKSSGPASAYKLDVNGAINGIGIYNNGKSVIDTIRMGNASATPLTVTSGAVVIPTVAGPAGADGVSMGTVTATASSAASSASPTVTVSQVTSNNKTNATFSFSIPKGANGTNGTGIGTVTATVASLASTAAPTVTVSQVTSGSNKNCTFAFSLPKGADGTNGTNGTNGISVGTVTATVASVASNVAPTVTVTTVTSGTNKNVTMAFKLPKGDTGATGATGVVSVVTAGSGNAVTSGSYNSSTKTVTLTKGSSFLASNGTAVCASKLGTATVGSTLQPIFLNSGTPTTCSGFMRNGNGLNILGGHVAIIDTNNEPLLLMSNTTASPAAHINYKQPDGYKAYTAYVLHAGSSTSYADLIAGNITAMTKMSAPAFYETSDARKKDIIGNLDLDKCMGLLDYCNQVVYKLKGDDKEQIGMIAQEVEEWFPEIVITDEDGYKSLDYSRLTVICLRLIKDLYDKVSNLKSYVNECE